MQSVFTVFKVALRVARPTTRSMPPVRDDLRLGPLRPAGSADLYDVPKARDKLIDAL
jgi:hypothetical protein